LQIIVTWHSPPKPEMGTLKNPKKAQNGSPSGIGCGGKIFNMMQKNLFEIKQSLFFITSCKRRTYVNKSPANPLLHSLVFSRFLLNLCTYSKPFIAAIIQVRSCIIAYSQSLNRFFKKLKNFWLKITCCIEVFTV
jgi:hypothetical protein